MNNDFVIEQIQSTWRYQRKITNDYLKQIPVENWNYTHHKKFATLAKQFRHMVWVYGAYIDGIENRKIDLSKKKSFYDGPLEKEAIQAALKSMDEKFFSVTDGLRSQNLDEYKIDFFGQEMGIIEYSHVMVQHESVHVGIWANYAAFAGFETPKSWQNDWEL